MIVAGKITYWEYAGLMDDADYANDFVRKVNTYANNDLLLGRDVRYSAYRIRVSAGAVMCYTSNGA